MTLLLVLCRSMLLVIPCVINHAVFGVVSADMRCMSIKTVLDHMSRHRGQQRIKHTNICDAVHDTLLSKSNMSYIIISCCSSRKTIYAQGHPHNETLSTDHTLGYQHVARREPVVNNHKSITTVADVFASYRHLNDWSPTKHQFIVSFYYLSS